ncbi:FAD-dependent thymidylate synthase [Paenibacillus campinasensis]|uniref:Flavin-dependent thymidylate synthase n=1 Tax=Paenibacillus campinasensis TaxID=66347 RepID=A0A268EH59_9BACL|nr:FAD-dependent thymidylate synthase [Paenibacillus campinasensis]PAD72419.1 thymidylate synthase (FAD) [Paenibacillus campinasensis]
MNVKLIAHTVLSDEFTDEVLTALAPKHVPNERAAVALTAIRTCYSPLKPTEIVAKEGAKYFGNAASDGEGGTDADRLFRHITRSGHTSTLEHITYTFAIEGVSRALLAQLTRHRHISFSVQSQRYVRMGSADKIGGMDYVTPPSIQDPNKTVVYYESYTKWLGLKANTPAQEIFDDAMAVAQETYDRLREAGVPPEDARMVLPNAAACNLVMTGNLRTFLDFYAKRRPGNGAQWEIADLAVKIRDEIVKVDPWLAPYFSEKEAVTSE